MCIRDRCRDGPFDFRAVGGPWQDPCRVHRILGFFSDLVFRVRYRTYIICLFRLRLGDRYRFWRECTGFSMSFRECRSAPYARSVSYPHLYPSSSIFALGINLNDALLMQYRNPPLSAGPSLKTCPRCASPVLLRISIRFIPWERSVFSITKLLSIGLEKLGHPQPESNLSVEINKGSPVVIST